jgi:RNA polymerase sigma factor (sigma-70 family)
MTERATSERASDRAWLQAALSRFEQPLLRYAARIVGDDEAARDVVQDTFCKLHGQPRDVVEPKLAEWLYTVCRNRALDVRRKEARMADVSDAALATSPSADPGPSAVAEVRDTSRKVSRLLATLPENQREVVRLKFEHGLSYQEIAKVTSLSVSNVGYLLHVAIKTLGQRLDAPVAKTA